MTQSFLVSASSFKGASVSSVCNEDGDISDTLDQISWVTWIPHRHLQFYGMKWHSWFLLPDSFLLQPSTAWYYIIIWQVMMETWEEVHFLPFSSGIPDDCTSDSHFWLTAHCSPISQSPLRTMRATSQPVSLLQFLVLLQPIINHQNQDKKHLYSALYADHCSKCIMCITSFNPYRSRRIPYLKWTWSFLF